MAIDIVDKKYFKLAVGTLRKEGINDCSTDCPQCGDTKNRLHLYLNDGMDQALVHCYNGGCELDDQQMGMVNFLKLVKPQLVPQYKRERFGDIITKLKDENKPSLNDILARVKKSKVTKVIETSEDLNKDKEIELVEKFKHIKTPLKKTLSLKKNLEVPKLFKEGLVSFKDSPEAMSYIKTRNLEPEEDWLFSYEKFVNYFDKSYFVENYFLIPLWQNEKFSGFYTRSINEKRFSTIIFPKREKYYAVKGLDYDKPCYIFEGILDAQSSGLENYAAMLSADLPDEFLEELADPIFCFDNDITGVNKALKYNSQGHKTFVWPENECKDMNEILQKGGTKEKNAIMIQDNIYQGIPGKIRLNLSKA